MLPAKAVVLPLPVNVSTFDNPPDNCVKCIISISAVLGGAVLNVNVVPLVEYVSLLW